MTTKTITVNLLVDGSSQAVGERDVPTGTNEGTVTLTNYKGNILYWQSSSDNGGTWVNINQTTEDLSYSNLTTTTQYRAVTSLCNTSYTSSACTVRVHSLTDDLTWTETKTFANDGSALISNSRAYMDGFGKLLQSQQKSFSTKLVLASQPLYDAYGKAVGNTLPAPIPFPFFYQFYGTDFRYAPTFAAPASSPTAPYDYTRFDTNATLNNPEALDTRTPGTLGWYYSTNNTMEPYTAVSTLPYSRSAALPDGSAGASRSAGPGLNQQMGGGHEAAQGTFSVRTELDEYAAIRSKLLDATAVGAQPVTMQLAAEQRLGTDPDGNSGVSFADKQGHPIMQALPATGTGSGADAWTTSSNQVEIGWPYKVQVPSITAPVVAAGSDLMAYDATGSWVATGAPDAVLQALTTRGLSSNITFYSNDPFTVSDAGVTYPGQAREAYSFFNFYVASGSSIQVTDLLPNSVCHLFNTLQNTEVSSIARGTPLTLAAGCYQLRIDQGAVQLAYANAYKDISYNFYNQKGQLVESIAPKGVQQLLQSWHSVGAAGFPYSATTAHPYSTKYEYDQQGRPSASTDPDAGRTQFLYRTDGKLRFSQNAKQAALGTFSYLGYDEIGRVVEVGECVITNNSPWSIATIPTSYPTWIEDNYYGGSGLPGYYLRRDVVRTTYDITNPVRSGQEAPNTDHNQPGYTATFLSGRIATVAKYAQGQPYGGYTLASQTWYSYDGQGRTIWQIQQTAGQPARTTDYVYDATGNVQSVCYQKNTPLERLTHYYTYDEDNRLRKVETDNMDPANSSVWGHILQASYSYYVHGPLKRVVYGNNLQGVDYTYTATGQLKSINDGDLQYDPGQDTGQQYFGTLYPDFFGTTLNYYQNDYASAAVPRTTTFMPFGSAYKEHYNGLISSTTWQTPGSALHGYGYSYNTKGQLLQADHGTLYNYSGPRQYGFSVDYGRHGEGNLDYDANGNLGHLKRTDGAGVSSFDINYEYAAGTNQLVAVHDMATASSTSLGTALISYGYDQIGQATSQQETTDPTKTKYLDYNVAGKVTALYLNASKTQVIARYTYDAFGQRLTQQVFPNPVDLTTYTTTTFVRDGAGQELASYIAETKAGATSPMFLYEQPIYGATRLGIYRQARPGDAAPAEQLYELNDHLGNTRVVFRKPTTTTYVLSMETRQATQERQDFPGPTAPAGSTYDAVRSGDYATSGGAYSSKLVAQQGPTKVIAAQRGDRFDLSVYALYANGSTSIPQRPSPNKAASTLIPGLSMLNIQPGLRTGHEMNRAQSPLTGWQRALGQISIGVSIPLFARSAAGLSTQAYLNGPPPNSGLQYVVKRASDGTTLRSGRTPLQSNASIDWQSLSLQLTITETEPVLVEVSTWNSAYSSPVYFDDLTVQYTTGPIVEENNFYPYGQRIDGLSWRRSDERLYGRGYQGQNTTQDAESGYTAFELRSYDSRIGRWISTDPYGQFSSPYVGMGNNPVSGIDPDGGWLFGLFGSTSAQRQGAKGFASATDGEVGDYYKSSIHVDWANDEGHIVTRFTSNGTPGSIGNATHDLVLDRIAVDEWHQTFHPDPGVAEPDFATSLAIAPVIRGAVGLTEGAIGLLRTNGEGFFIGSITMRAPFNINVQRFGGLIGPAKDFGLRVGPGRIVNRLFSAIKPEWNTLETYHLGVIPKGTQFEFGIAGPQFIPTRPFILPGGLPQFRLPPGQVFIQSTTTIVR